MIVPMSSPLQVVHRRAVNQYDQFRRAPAEGKPDRFPVERKRVAVLTQAHFNCQRIPGLGQVVAKHAVQRSEERFPLRSGNALSEERSKTRERKVEAPANPLCDATNALVYDPGERTHGARKRLS